MATLRSLSVSVGADTAPLKKSLDKGSKDVANFHKMVSSTGKNIGDIFGKISLGGLALGASLTAVSLMTMENIDSLGDMASQLGITTESLSSFRYVAQLSGSNAESLDNALTKMSANLGDAALKVTPTSDALKRLGLDAKSLAGMSADQAFLNIIKGFEGITNANERTSLAMDIFSKSGIQILNVLQVGSKEFANLRNEARQLGVEISSIGWAKVAVAKDALDRAWFAVQGLSNTLATKVAPLVEAIANRFTDLLKGANGGGDLIDNVLSTVRDGIGQVLSGMQILFREIQKFVAYMNEDGWLTQLSKGVQSGVSFAMFGDTSGQKTKGSGLAMAGGGAVASSESLIGDKFINGWNQVLTSADTAAKKFLAGGGNSSHAMSKASEEFAQKMVKASEELESFSKTLKDKIATPLETYWNEIQKINQAVAKKLLTPQEGEHGRKSAFKEFSKDAKGIFDKTRTPMEKFKTEMDELREQFKLGLIDENTFKRASKMSAKENAPQGNQHKFVGAMELGSKEAYSAILAAQGQSTGNPIMQRIADETLKVAKQQRDEMIKFNAKKAQEVVKIQ